MISYTLDENDRITEIGGDWDDFAQSNDGADVVAERVLGRPLFDFVEGDDVVQLYHLLFRRARTGQRPLAFTFRCDSPDCRRRMSFEARPLPDGALLVRTHVLDESERLPVPILFRDAAHNDLFIVACAICGKVRLDDGTWVDIEEANARFGWTEAPAVPRLSHSYCPPCLADQLSLAGAEKLA